MRCVGPRQHQIMQVLTTTAFFYFWRRIACAESLFLLMLLCLTCSNIDMYYFSFRFLDLQTLLFFDNRFKKDLDLTLTLLLPVQCQNLKVDELHHTCNTCYERFMPSWPLQLWPFVRVLYFHCSFVSVSCFSSVNRPLVCGCQAAICTGWGKGKISPLYVQMI